MFPKFLYNSPHNPYKQSRMPRPYRHTMDRECLHSYYSHWNSWLDEFEQAMSWAWFVLNCVYYLRQSQVWVRTCQSQCLVLFDEPYACRKCCVCWEFFVLVEILMSQLRDHPCLPSQETTLEIKERNYAYFDRIY